MESILGAAAQASISAEAIASIIKDDAGAQLINKTLEKLNAGMAISGPVIDSDYQFQKVVLNAAGIGNKLDSTV